MEGLTGSLLFGIGMGTTLHLLGVQFSTKKYWIGVVTLAMLFAIVRNL